MRMSYANVRAEFFQLLLDMPNSGICYNHARNFYAMMEFFIPLVGLLSDSLFLCSIMDYVFVRQTLQTFGDCLISFILLLQYLEVVNTMDALGLQQLLLLRGQESPCHATAW